MIEYYNSRDILGFIYSTNYAISEKKFREKFYPSRKMFRDFLQVPLKKQMRYKNFRKQLQYLGGQLWVVTNLQENDYYREYRINLEDKDSLMRTLIQEWKKQNDDFYRDMKKVNKDRHADEKQRERMLEDWLDEKAKVKDVYTLCKFAYLDISVPNRYMAGEEGNLDSYLEICNAIGVTLKVTYEDEAWYIGYESWNKK